MGARRLPPRLPLAASETEIERVARIARARRTQALSQSLSDLTSLQRDLQSVAEGKLTEEAVDNVIRRSTTRLGLRSNILHLARVSLEIEMARIKSQLLEESGPSDRSES